MTMIDWTKPLELTSGEPVIYRGPSNDGDGHYVTLRGECRDYNNAGEHLYKGLPNIRNVVTSPTPNFTRTRDGRKARVVAEYVNYEGVPKLLALIGTGTDGREGPISYLTDGRYRPFAAYGDGSSDLMVEPVVETRVTGADLILPGEDDERYVNLSVTLTDGVITSVELIK